MVSKDAAWMQGCREWQHCAQAATGHLPLWCQWAPKGRRKVVFSKLVLFNGNFSGQAEFNLLCFGVVLSGLL